MSTDLDIYRGSGLAERQQYAMMLHVGFWQLPFTNLLPCTTNRFFTSCDCSN